MHIVLGNRDNEMGSKPHREWLFVKLESLAMPSSSL
jgi:hypothetical protein